MEYPIQALVMYSSYISFSKPRQHILFMIINCFHVQFLFPTILMSQTYSDTNPTCILCRKEITIFYCDKTYVTKHNFMSMEELIILKYLLDLYLVPLTITLTGYFLLTLSSLWICIRKY